MIDLNSKSAQNGKPSLGFKAKSAVAQGLRDLFIDKLKDAYWAEKELTKAIPIMIKNATDVKLKEALTGHLEETRNQVIRLEEVFHELAESSGKK